MSHLNYNFNICTISFDENLIRVITNSCTKLTLRRITAFILASAALEPQAMDAWKWTGDGRSWTLDLNEATAFQPLNCVMSHFCHINWSPRAADLGLILVIQVWILFFVNILNLLGIESPIKHLISYWLHFVAGKLFKNFSNTIYSTSWFSTGWSATSRPPITTRSNPSRRRSCARSAASPTFMKGVSPLQEL